jgi:hypothetical protein
MYRALEPAKIIDTIARLGARIAERFPDSGLYKVSEELLAVAKAGAARAEELGKANWALRAGITVLAVAGVLAQVWAARSLHVRMSELDAAGLVQGLEAAVNLLLLFAAAAWFVISLEARFKRNKALAALHELRSLAHVVDMHQLTKDPTALLAPSARTASSPQRSMNEFQLTRYLEYCAEMLALMGKIAALYAQRTGDGVVVDAVNDIENLCANLGRKIWQKIMIIGQLREQH